MYSKFYKLLQKFQLRGRFKFIYYSFCWTQHFNSMQIVFKKISAKANRLGKFSITDTKLKIRNHSDI